MKMNCKVLQTVKNKFDEKLQSYIYDSDCYQEFINKALSYNEKFPVYTNEYLLDLCGEWWNEYWSKYI